jgi:hypothetical protein
MDPKLFARGTSQVLGTWLFLSSFFWQHSRPEFMNAWIVGLLIMAFATASLWVPPIRFANTALAMWLFVSSWLLPRVSEGTFWNHWLVAIAVFIASLIPSESLFDKTTPMASGKMASIPHSA